MIEISWKMTWKMIKINSICLHISSSLTSQWLSPQSMNTYQSCQSRNSFGYGSQLPSAVQSINSFPALSNNIGEFNSDDIFIFWFERFEMINCNYSDIFTVSGSTSPTARRLDYPYSYDSPSEYKITFSFLDWNLRFFPKIFLTFFIFRHNSWSTDGERRA